MDPMKRIAALGTATCLAVFGGGLRASVASAGPGDTNTSGVRTSSGYLVDARITFTGDGIPGGRSTRTVQVPAQCWWEPIPSNTLLNDPPVDATNPQSVMDWYEVSYPALNGTFAPARGVFPDRKVFERAIAREAAGEDLTWYRARCRDGVDMIDAGFAPGTNPAPASWGGQIAVSYAVFPTAAGPPQPLIATEDLARAAREAMVIDPPAIDRNPKADRLGASTFVSLATWFWVTNPAGALNTDGVATVRATVVGTGVWAEVTAETDGLSITGPGTQGTFCPPDRAAIAWTLGASDASGCTAVFDRASVGYASGYPVTAATLWTANWVASDTPTPQALDPLPRSATVEVPVGESQAVVRKTAS
jgi:hypothetical protein